MSVKDWDVGLELAHVASVDRRKSGLVNGGPMLRTDNQAVGPMAERAPFRAAEVSSFGAPVPALDVVRVPKAGHDLLIDNPFAISEAVWAFLLR